MRLSVHNAKVDTDADHRTWASILSHALTLTTKKLELVALNAEIADFNNEVNALADATELEGTKAITDKRLAHAASTISIAGTMATQTISLNKANDAIQLGPWSVEAKADAQGIRDTAINL